MAQVLPLKPLRSGWMVCRSHQGLMEGAPWDHGRNQAVLPAIGALSGHLETQTLTEVTRL
jgi:hypothetical protein